MLSLGLQLLLIHKCVVDAVVQVGIVILLVLSVQVAAALAEFDNLRPFGLHELKHFGGPLE